MLGGSLTCRANIEVGGFVGDVAHGLDAGAFHRDLGGISQRFVHVHLKRTFRNLLARKQHGHLGNRNQSHPLGKFHPAVSRQVQGGLPCEDQ